MTRQRPGREREVVPHGPSPIVATATFLTTLVVVLCVVLAAILVWRAPQEESTATRDAAATSDGSAADAAEGVGVVEDTAAALTGANAAEVPAAAAAATGHATASACADAASDGTTLVSLASAAVTPDRWIGDGVIEALAGAPFEELAVRCGSGYATEAVTAAGLTGDVAGVVGAHVRNGGLRSAVDAAQERDRLAAQVPPELLVGDAATTALAAFALPSGNVVCAIGPASARCDIAAAAYDRSDAPADCPTGWALALQVDPNGGAPLCAGDRAMPVVADVLAYGASTRVGGYSCASSEQGVACREDASGHGFWLRGEGYVTF